MPVLAPKGGEEGGVASTCSDFCRLHGGGEICYYMLHDGGVGLSNRCSMRLFFQGLMAEDDKTCLIEQVSFVGGVKY